MYSWAYEYFIDTYIYVSRGVVRSGSLRYFSFLYFLVNEQHFPTLHFLSQYLQFFFLLVSILPFLVVKVGSMGRERCWYGEGTYIFLGIGIDGEEMGGRGGGLEREWIRECLLGKHKSRSKEKNAISHPSTNEPESIKSLHYLYFLQCREYRSNPLLTAAQQLSMQQPMSSPFVYRVSGI